MEIHHPILFFDGVCNLCNGAVQTILLNDKRGDLRFASLQSNLAGQLLPATGIDPDDLSTLVLFQDGKAYTHSDGVLRVTGLMGGKFAYLRHLRFLPRLLRDRVYDFVARNRYRWFGKQDSCMMPRPEWKDRFLEV